MRPLLMLRAVSLLVLPVGVVAFGCATSGDELSSDVALDAVEPTDAPSKLPAPSVTTPPADAGTKRSGASADAGKDAGKPAPAAGEPCGTVDEIFTRACGACGSQSALCFSQEGDAGIVSDYSACADEVVGGCAAGTVETNPCGNCGTQKRTCSSACEWSVGACVQPQNACKPDTVEYTVTGCPTRNTYRQRACSAGCGWSSYTACVAPSNELVVDVSPTVSQSSTVGVALNVGRVASAIPPSGSCPAASLLAGDYPYAYVEVRNSSTKQATVTVTTATAAGGSNIYASLAGYQIPFEPSGDEARKACSAGPSSALYNVVIPAGTSMLVYVRSYYAYNAASPSQSTGVINLVVRTTALN